MVNCSIIVEGGGTGPSLKADMAAGFRSFFEKIDPAMARPRLIRGGGRTQALDKFVTAWQSRKPGDIVMLLIDSEEPIPFGDSKLDHLVRRDAWTAKPSDVAENDVFLMVCVMEAWICADRDALRTFYKGGFDETKLPPVQNLESVKRHLLYEKLAAATKNCKERKAYDKGDHSFELIGRISPEVVTALPHGKQFLTEMKARLPRRP